MDGQKLALSSAVVILGLACFIIGTVAIIIPQWGTFRTRVHAERGNFGPWSMCKDVGYGRQVCGAHVASFKPSFAVFAAGVCGAIGIGALGAYCLTSIFQIAMQVTQSRVLAKYYLAIVAKLLCSVIAALLTITAVCLFATQDDDLVRGYIIEAGVSFYLEVVLAIFTFILMLLTVVEFTIARRFRNGAEDSGKRGVVHDPRRGAGNQGLLQSGFGTTIGNPGFRDRGNANGISMTDSSVRFVSSSSMSKFPQPLNNTSNHSKQTSRLALARNLSANSQRRKQSKKSKNSSSKKTSSFKSSKPTNNSNSSDANWNDSTMSISQASNGSSISVISSVSTMSTMASTVSPLPRGPLRSSLKKSKPPQDEFGIQNPGFSSTSPTLSRNGSLKKVRIQTQSTDV